MSSISRKSKSSFALGGMGYHLYVGVIMNYLLIFYTDVMGIAAGAVATLFLVTRIWDAVNDPLMGMIVDKTKSKRWGKFKVYLLTTPLPLAVVFVLMFTVLDLDPTAKLVYAYITYTLYGMIYTMFEVPYWGTSSVMTQDVKERSSLISVTKALQMVGVLVGIVATIPLVNMLGGDNVSRGWFLMALIIGTLGFILTQLPSMGITYDNKLEKPASGNVLKNFVDIAKHNKPLLILTIALGTTFFAVMINSLLTYFVVYNLGLPDLLPVFGLVPFLFTIIGMFFVPMLIRKTGDKKRLLIYATFVDITFKVIFFFIGYQLPLPVILAAVALMGMVGSVPIVILQIMYADCIEYNELVTGERNDGVIFSIKSFIEKLRMALGGAAGAWLLSYINYIPNQAQTPETLRGIFIGISLLPALGLVLFLVPLMFYPLTDKKHQEILDELAAKRGV